MYGEERKEGEQHRSAEETDDGRVERRKAWLGNLFDAAGPSLACHLESRGENTNSLSDTLT